MKSQRYLSIYLNNDYPEHNVFMTTVIFGDYPANNKRQDELIGYVALNEKGYWEVWEIAGFIDDRTGQFFQEKNVVKVTKSEFAALKFAKEHFLTLSDLFYKKNPKKKRV